jgi:hypothetical protein
MSVCLCVSVYVRESVCVCFDKKNSQRVDKHVNKTASGLGGVSKTRRTPAHTRARPLKTSVEFFFRFVLSCLFVSLHSFVSLGRAVAAV